MSSRSGSAVGPVLCLALMAMLTACGSTGSRPAAEAPAAAEAALPGSAAAAPDGAAVLPEIPEAARALHARATAAMADEAWLDAELELEQLVLEFPSFPGPYVNLAIVHRRNGREAEAETALRQALAIDPDHPAANNELGMLQRERGEFEAAEASYRRAIAGDPAYSWAHYNLGVLLDLYLQRADEALAHYETYQSLLEQPDQQVNFWIVDLRRRLGLPAPGAAAEETAQLAREDGR